MEKEFTSFVDWLYGIDYLHKAREDFKEIFLENKDLSSVNIDRAKALKEIKNSKKQARNKQRKMELVAYILGGPLAYFLPKILSSWWVFPLLGFIYGIVFPIEITLRKISIDILAYEGGSMTMTKNEVIFRRAWNIGVLKSVLSLALFPIVTLIMKYSEESYEKGLKILGNWIRGGKFDRK